jgi:hypothetical protein
VEEKAKTCGEGDSSLWIEVQKQAQYDPELAEKLEAAKRVTERYSEALRRLADS